MERGLRVISITAGVSEALYPKKMFGSAVEDEHGDEQDSDQNTDNQLDQKGAASP